MYTAHFSSCASPINKIFFALHKITPDLSELNISASHYQPFYGKYCETIFIVYKIRDHRKDQTNTNFWLLQEIRFEPIKHEKKFGERCC